MTGSSSVADIRIRSLVAERILVVQLLEGAKIENKIY